MGTVEYALISFDEDLYRYDAAETLASLFDIGINVCGIEGPILADAFVNSGISRHFEIRNPAYVAGKSATELLEMLLEYMQSDIEVPYCERFERTPEYWLGWTLAMCQSNTGRRFATYFDVLGYDYMVGLYRPLHEAPESKFMHTVERELSCRRANTKLKKQRLAAGLSQAELSSRSGVGLRSIQMYEQRNKNIDNASASTLYRLAHTLHCSIEDLMEAL